MFPSLARYGRRETSQPKIGLFSWHPAITDSHYYGQMTLPQVSDVNRSWLYYLPFIRFKQNLIFYHYIIIQRRRRESVALDQKNSLWFKVKTMKLVKGLRKQLQFASMVTLIFVKNISLSFNNIIGVFIRLLNFFLWLIHSDLYIPTFPSSDFLC